MRHEVENSMLLRAAPAAFDLIRGRVKSLSRRFCPNKR